MAYGEHDITLAHFRDGIGKDAAVAPDQTEFAAEHAADIMRIASTRATFAENFVRVGLISGDGGAQALAERIARNPPRQLRMAKRLIREGLNTRLEGVLELAAAYQGVCHQTGDHAEAVDALLEKRAPAFTGQRGAARLEGSEDRAYFNGVRAMRLFSFSKPG